MSWKFSFWDKPELPQWKKTPYEGDLSKTNILYNLFAIPKENRSEQWLKSFQENVADAAFRCHDSQIIQGPDGFSYFLLYLPDQYQPFQAFVIRKMKDDFLLEAGYGIVINPKGQYADWVFSYGDIVNFHISGQFYTSLPTTEQSDDAYLLGDVSVVELTENYLPKQARSVIKDFLRSQKIQHPKALLFTKNMDGINVQRLAFDLYPQDFPTNRHYDFAINHMSWFLPRHYKIVQLPAANNWKQSFVNL